MKIISYAVLTLTCFNLMPAYAVVDYSIIVERSIFADRPPLPKPVEPVITPILKPPEIPALDSLIEVKGIVYFFEGTSFVVIRLKRSNQEVFYKEGDIIGEAKIVKVNEKNVVFMYNEKEEKLELKEETGLASIKRRDTAANIESQLELKPSGNINRIVKPSIAEFPRFEKPVTVNLEQTMNEFKENTELVKNLNAIPEIQDGKIEGFKIDDISEGSLPYQYGLRNGDVLRKVNGALIDSMAKGFSIYNQIIKDGIKVVTIEVLRNNSPLVLTFKLE